MCKFSLYSQRSKFDEAETDDNRCEQRTSTHWLSSTRPRVESAEEALPEMQRSSDWRVQQHWWLALFPKNPDFFNDVGRTSLNLQKGSNLSVNLMKRFSFFLSFLSATAALSCVPQVHFVFSRSLFGSKKNLTFWSYLTLLLGFVWKLRSLVFS